MFINRVVNYLANVVIYMEINWDSNVFIKLNINTGGSPETEIDVLGTITPSHCSLLMTQVILHEVLKY